MNVHFSDACRKYNADVPVFLHNRPRDFVQHVSSRWTSAHDIPATNISQLDERSFQVISVDSNNTYVVSFGSSSDASSMPHCDCYDWRKYHWPCKHFCAIFLHVASHGWNSLAADYRDSPHFSIDSDLFHSHDSVPTTSPAPGISHGDEDDDDAAEAADGENQHVTPTCSSSASAKHCREVLRELTDLTYLATDLCPLTVLHEQLQVALCTLKQSIPQDAGLLLEDKTSRMHSGVKRCRLRNIPTRRAKSKVRRARRRSVPAPVAEEPVMEMQSAVTTTFSTVESSVDLHVMDWATDSSAPVVEEPLMATQPAVVTTYSTVESSTDLDVTDWATDAAPRPSKKLIMAALHEPAVGCQGINISQSDFLTLLPGQWLSDNVSGFYSTA